MTVPTLNHFHAQQLTTDATELQMAETERWPPAQSASGSKCHQTLGFTAWIQLNTDMLTFIGKCLSPDSQMLWQPL